MKLRRTTGLVAGLLSLGLLTAGPAVAAGPATVNVRVEGADQTLVPRTALTTAVRAVNLDGQAGHDCTGTSAFGALDQATAGAIGAHWDPTYAYQLDRVKGETLDSSGASGQYWAFWINDKFASAGLCQTELQTGDSVLLYPDCYGTGCVNPSPLRLSGVPATAKPGDGATVRVDALGFDGAATPAAGATVSAGGQSVATGADGTARVSFSGAGPVNVQATKPGTVRSATETTCVTSGADGACGTSPATGSGGVPPAQCATDGADGRCGTPDRSAPRVGLRGLRDGHRYARRHAPRTLRGTVSSDASGLRAIQLRLKRRDGRRCAAYSGSRERWVTRSCWHNAKWFGVGDRESWSYLLPGRLTRGRYTLDVRAIDGAGNVSSLKRGRSRVVFRVL
jgi:hypothetical protein